jgi:hypothetical protein
MSEQEDGEDELQVLKPLPIPLGDLVSEDKIEPPQTLPE